MKLRDLRKSERFVVWSGRLVGWILRALAATWRIEGEDPFVQGESCIVVTWHRNLFVAAALWRDRGVVVPVSRSRDGDLIDAVLRTLGFGPSPRGSSSKGAPRLARELMRAARKGIVGVLPDGPRGPARQVKPGVVAIARGAGVPMVPVGVAARPALRFGSWDRALLPLPFARIWRTFGRPIDVPKSTDGPGREAIRAVLEKELDRLTADLDARLGVPAVPGHGRTR